MPNVHCATQELRAFTGGEEEVEVDAKDVRGLIAELERRFPGLGAHVEAHMALAIDGEIYQDAFDTPLPPDSEIMLIPRISGG